jgi:hypothetical protein
VVRELRIGTGAKGWWGYDFDGVEPEAKTVHRGIKAGADWVGSEFFLAQSVFGAGDLAALESWPDPQ